MVKTSCYNLKGTELKKCQTRAKRAMIKEYGGSSEKESFLMWGRTPIKPEVGTLVPIPPQATTFIDYSRKNAEKLASELKKLTGEPVILTGGGGYGYKFGFLNKVEVTHCGHPALKDKWGNIIRDEYENWFEDKSKPIECSVEVSLKTFEGKERTPYIGSYRITALHGYGANRLAEKVPRSWGRD